MRTMMMAAALIAAGLTADALATSQEKKFEVSAGQKLEIELETGGSIRITGVDGNTVTVKTTAHGQDSDEFELHVDKTKNGVRIDTGHARSHRNWSGGVDVDVTVPRRFDVDLETSGGGITIQGVEGKLEGSTMGGALDLKNIKGVVKMSTMGGSVTLTSSEVDGELSTMGGRVVFRDVKGDVKGSSMGGDVVYDNVTRSDDASSAKKPVEISTMGGDITVETAPAGATVSTMGGDIEITSAAHYVKAKTMGGGIEIKAIDGGVTATTMGGDIQVTMVGDPAVGDRAVELESKGGEITLVVPAALSMAIDVEISYTKNSSRNYKIVSDFPITVSESSEWDYKSNGGRKVIRGTGSVAGGKNQVHIETVNGDVTIRRGK